MEADFSFANEIYFGQRMIEEARENLLPAEQFAVKNSSSVEVVVCRSLFFDIVRQRKYNSALISYDEAQ